MANRAWLYCRIGGGHEHEEQALLDSQEQRLLDYCAQQGLQVVGCTQVSGSGAGDLEKLTGQGVEQGNFDFLVANSASRLTRNIMDLLTAAHTLEEQGIGICLVQEGICTLPIQSQEQDISMEMGGLA